MDKATLLVGFLDDLVDDLSRAGDQRTMVRLSADHTGSEVLLAIPNLYERSINIVVEGLLLP